MLENLTRLKHIENNIESTFMTISGASLSHVKSALMHFMKVVCNLEDQHLAIEAAKKAAEELAKKSDENIEKPVDDTTLPVEDISQAIPQEEIKES